MAFNWHGFIAEFEREEDCNSYSKTDKSHKAFITTVLRIDEKAIPIGDAF